VLRINRWGRAVRALLTFGFAIVLFWEFTSSHNIANAVGFFNRGSATQAEKSAPAKVSNKPLSKPSGKSSGKIAEVSPPPAIQTLRQELENYQPQVSILSPKMNETLQDTTVSVQFQVKDLPLFKNEPLGLGPHLHVFLDNQPYQAVYDANQPLVFKDVPPGTHTIRAFASRPWHESFKNDGAYVQTTFHIFSQTQENNPNPKLPLLTYSRPQASYGAEPIMLDFYLTNAPLHLVAQESSKDEIADWRIRCTVNGDSFVLDRWQPIYLKGFKPGKNWVQLEYLDEQGNPVPNAFNNTVRLINYEPGGKDALAKLTRGDLSAADARGIVDPNYKPAPLPVPTVTPTPALLPKPAVSPTPKPSISPSPTASPKPTVFPTINPIPIPVVPEPASSPSLAAPTQPLNQEPVPRVSVPPKVEIAPAPKVAPAEKPTAEKAKPTNNPVGKLFDRVRLPFGKSSTTPPKAVPTTPKSTEPIAPKVPAAIETAPQTTPPPSSAVEKAPPALPASPQPQPSPTPKLIPPTPKTVVPKSEPSPIPAEQKPAVISPAAPSASQSPKNQYLERYRRPKPSPIVPSPTPSPTVTPDQPLPSPSANPVPAFAKEKALAP
jgi:hypothetical protein